jgi:hypothetical protein
MLLLVIFLIYIFVIQQRLTNTMVVVYFSRFIYKRNAFLLFYCIRNYIQSNIYTLYIQIWRIHI